MQPQSALADPQGTTQNAAHGPTRDDCAQSTLVDANANTTTTHSFLLALEKNSCVAVKWRQDTEVAVWFGVVGKKRCSDNSFAVGYSLWWCNRRMKQMPFMSKNGVPYQQCGRLPPAHPSIEILAVQKLNDLTDMSFVSSLLSTKVDIPVEGPEVEVVHPTPSVVLPAISNVGVECDSQRLPIGAVEGPGAAMLNIPPVVPPAVVNTERSQAQVQAATIETETSDDDDDDDEEDVADIFDDVVVRSQVSLHPDVKSAFQASHGLQIPPVTLMKGIDLLHFLQLPHVMMSSVAEAALAPSTRKAHRNMMNRLEAGIAPSESLQQASMALSVIALMTQQMQARGWKPSTLLKYLATCQAVCAALPLYRTGTAPVHLQNDPEWIAAMKSVAISTRESKPLQARPITLDDVHKVVNNCKSLPIRVLVIIAWMTCARTGCVRQLLKHNIIFNEVEQTLTVTFTRGKVVRRKGPITLPSTARVPTRWWSLLQRWAATRRTTFFPNAITNVQVKAALREIHPEYENRSLRRGALQHLARTGTPEETILAFSTHASIQMLRRYLQWGQLLKHTGDVMREAAKGHATSIPREETSDPIEHGEEAWLQL